MNVIVEIDGREALPVRAIPLLTDWKEMSPDAVAKALAGDEHYYYFDGLCAYRIEGGATKPIRATWWQGFAVRNLKALSDRIKADQVTHEAGHQKWRKESLAELPAGVFVWKDEYVPMYESRYGPDEMARILGRELTPSEIQARELDFDPFISAEYAALVKENFAYQQHVPAQTATPVPVVAASDGPAPVSQVTVVDSYSEEHPVSMSLEVTASAEHAPKSADSGPIFSMTKVGLINAHEHEWPTIRGDIAAAASNGLATAKANTRGWYEGIAMEWARAKGRLKTTSEPTATLNTAMVRMANLPSRKYTLE